MAIFKIWGPVSALLLAALLAAGARADHVTTERCKTVHPNARVRRYPTDNDATRIYISNCKYNNVNPNDFTGLTSVKNLHLGKNDIVSIHPDIFRSVPGLKEVDLSINKLRELPVFAEHSCPNLTDLYLTRNLITGLWSARTFSACNNLESIFLGINHIEYVHPEAFSSLHQLIQVYLNNNKIKFISNQMFENNHKLKALMLHQNRISHLPLDFASNLKRAGVSLKWLYFFSNPWHCACLLEALADVKRAGVNYYEKYVYVTNIIHYDGTRAACVYTGAVPCRPTLLRPAPRPVCGV